MPSIPFRIFLGTDTAKDTLIVTLGTFINVISGALFFIFVPRILGPVNYGIFSTVTSTGLMAASIANFGIDTGILRFIKNGLKESDKILSIAFKSYIILGLIVAIIGFLSAKIIAGFLGQPYITNLLRIAFIGNIFILLTNFFVAGLQSKRQFAKASIVNISSNVSRITILFIGAYFFTIGLYFLTALFFLVTIISVIVGKLFLTFKLQTVDKSKTLDFYKYNFWIAISLIISSIPFDNYFILKVAGPAETGIYAAPLKILTFSYQFGGNFTRVIASRLSSFDSYQKVKDYIFKAMMPVSLFIMGLLFLMAISGPIINFLFGEEFKASVTIIRILAVGFIFFFASTIPSSIILYYLGKSRTLFAITTFRYFVFVVLLFILVQRYGAIGAAFAFTISELLAFVLMTLYAFANLKIFDPNQ